MCVRENGSVCVRSISAFSCDTHSVTPLRMWGLATAVDSWKELDTMALTYIMGIIDNYFVKVSALM